MLPQRATGENHKQLLSMIGKRQWRNCPASALKAMGLGAAKKENRKELPRLGKPIFTNGVTTDGLSYNYARVCIKVYADIELQDSIEYQDPYGNCFVQPVLYEWRPPRCSNCCNFGHTLERCPESNLETMIEKFAEQERREFKMKTKVDLIDNEKECVEETPDLGVI
ncbi:hypothetical protein QQ045_031080 [Rhodiola kirilowii]